MTAPLRIFDLRERPEHAAVVVQRIWATFWKHRETPFETIRNGLDAILRNETGVPFALVAEIDGQACGNALVIENDESSRPHLRPWPRLARAGARRRPAPAGALRP